MLDAFEQKQATMFLALEKLFVLHDALLFESQLINAAFMYSISILILVLTSTKPTYNVRPQFYIGKFIYCCILSYVKVYIFSYKSSNVNEFFLQVYVLQ